jgi:hypothetical protein
MSKRKKSSAFSIIESLDCEYEDCEEAGVTDYIDCGADAIATFNFTKSPLHGSLSNNEPQAMKTATKSQSEVKESSSPSLVIAAPQQPQPNGITPPVDGEHFEVKRTFVFRRSTIRILNQLKASHPKENAYLSSIIDSALLHYYNHIFSEGGSQI